MMGDNYANIVQNNLKRLYGNSPKDLAQALPAQQDGKNFLFNAFGENCKMRPEGIFLAQVRQTGVIGILISLYTLNA
ncbi:MAG: hypothetical protein QNL11_02345, partial [Desulfobacterales bacterium]|nr:hypothetical protein [Desulfobacterales bacterium]